tara:strand:+ start:244 stop:1011 length:768 start_codon:yes stop_codon:yes gene_type:complete
VAPKAHKNQKQEQTNNTADTNVNQLNNNNNNNPVQEYPNSQQNEYKQRKNNWYWPRNPNKNTTHTPSSTYHSQSRNLFFINFGGNSRNQNHQRTENNYNTNYQDRNRCAGFFHSISDTIESGAKYTYNICDSIRRGCCTGNIAQIVIDSTSEACNTVSEGVSSALESDCVQNLGETFVYYSKEAFEFTEKGFNNFVDEVPGLLQNVAKFTEEGLSTIVSEGAGLVENGAEIAEEALGLLPNIIGAADNILSVVEF